MLSRRGLRVRNDPTNRSILKKFFQETDVLTDMILHALHEDEDDRGVGKPIDLREEERHGNLTS